eukprot:gene39353-48626_t
MAVHSDVNHCGVTTGTSHPLPLISPTPPSNQIAHDSVEKLAEILLLAESLGVHYGPVRITSTHKAYSTATSIDCNSYSGGMGSTGVTSEFAATVVWMMSAGTFQVRVFLRNCWDTEPDVTHSLYLQSEKMMPFQKKWSDFYMCSWPEDMISQLSFSNQFLTDFTSTTVDNTVLAEAFAKLNEQFLYPVPE